MSLHPLALYEVPEETVRVAHVAFPKGNIYLQWYDLFGVLFADEEFATLFANDGQPALSPVRLSLVLLMQFVEGLSDRQAADAVRSRIDWKYLLCLDLTNADFHYSALSEFRSRWLVGNMEHWLFEKLLIQLQMKNLLKHRGKQRTDSTHVLASIRALNQVELVGETLRHALNVLAYSCPAWMLANSHPDWIERYGDRVRDYRLPKQESERQVYVQTVGADGLALLTAIWQDRAMSGLRDLPAIHTLWQVWVQNYTWQDNDTLRFRNAQEKPPAGMSIRSPYDCEAHFAKKRSLAWVGYKVHLTETCDLDKPRLITHVETTAAPNHDIKMTETIHQALEAKDYLPEMHLVDNGYVDAGLLVISQEHYGIDLLGPTRADTG